MALRRVLAPALLLLAASAVAADSPVKEASTRTSEDVLAAATARLDSAVDRAEDAPVEDMAGRSQRADLLGRAGDLRREAATTLREGASRDALVTRMDAVALSLIALADDASGTGEKAPAAAEEAAPFGEATGAGAGLKNPHSATTVVRFRDVAEDVRAVYPRLTEAERADAGQLIQAGEDVVALVKDARRSDHQTRTQHLRSIEDITRQLQALHQTGLTDRKKGVPFVPAWRRPDGWLPVEAAAAGLRALRVRFEKPGSAWVMIENDSTQPAEYFAEIEFYDHVGESTGMASVRSEPRRELKAGEVRRVLLPIIPTTPRFWEETTGFSIYVE